MFFKKWALFGFLFGMAGVNITLGQQFYLQQGSRAYQEQDFAAAIQYLEQALAEDSLQLRTYVLLGSSYLAEQQPILAERTAEKGLGHFNGNSSLRWIKAEALLQQNLPEKAIGIYTELHEMPNSPPASPLFNERQLKQRIGLIHQTLGAGAFRSGQFDRAVRHFSKTREILPDSVNSYKNLAMVYLKQEKWGKAHKVVEEALAKFPDDFELMRIRANILLETGNFEGVMQQSEELYRKNPDDTEIALSYAQLLLTRGNSRKAYEIYDRLLKEEPENREIYNSLIEMYERQRNWEAKRGVLRRMKEEFPGDSSLQRKIAHTYERQEMWQKALQAYDSVMTEGVRDREIDLAVAGIYEQQDSLAQALEVYHSSLEIFDRDSTLLRKKASIEQKMGNFGQALKTYRKLLGITGSSSDYLSIAKVLEEMDRAGEALRHYQKAIESGSRNPEAYYRAARLLYREGDRNLALTRSREALEFALEGIREEERQLKEMLRRETNLVEIETDGQTSQKIETYDRRAEKAFVFITEKFDRQEAAPVLENLEERYPESARLLFLLGRYYRNTGDTKHAFALLQKSARLNPDLAEVHLSLGEYHKARGDNVKAVQSYERALSANPRSSGPYERLIELYRVIGELDRLCDRWKARYRTRSDNEVLKTHLIEALHKAGRLDEARKVVETGQGNTP